MLEQDICGYAKSVGRKHFFQIIKSRKRGKHMIQIDMDMPEACNKETYRNGYYIYEHCKLFDACNKAVLFRKNYKPDNCPLKEVSQEPIIDKIRAEIEDLDIFYDNDYFSSNKDAMFKRSDVLQIIDKYRAESEGKV